MGNALLNRKILVTRPEQQAEKLCTMIENDGGIALRFPVQMILPTPVNPMLNDMITHMSRYQLAIFISANAVLHTLKLLHQDTFVLNAMTVFAVGNATARALRDAGVTDVICPGMAGGSETLLELPELQTAQVDGKRIIIFRGMGGREYLFRELKARGAEPDYAEVYGRAPVHYEKSTLDDLWMVQKPEIIVVSSNKGLQVLVDMQSQEHRVIMQETDLVVLSERAAELARTLGFSKSPYLAKDTGDTGLLEALRRWAAQYDKTGIP